MLRLIIAALILLATLSRADTRRLEFIGRDSFTVTMPDRDGDPGDVLVIDNDGQARWEAR